MPTRLRTTQPHLVIRREAYERAGLVRAQLDQRLGLTDEEFRVDGSLVILGPIPSATDLPDVIADLEHAGLAYFDDFFEVSANWPDWIGLVVMESDGT